MLKIFAAAMLLLWPFAAVAQTEVARYTVKKGDTLSEITRDVLGSKNWTAVFDDNQRRFHKGKNGKSPHLIYPGQVIVLVR